MKKNILVTFDIQIGDWDNQGLNVISVYSTQEITDKEVKTLKRLGVA